MSVQVKIEDDCGDDAHLQHLPSVFPSTPSKKRPQVKLEEGADETPSPTADSQILQENDQYSAFDQQQPEPATRPKKKRKKSMRSEGQEQQQAEQRLCKQETPPDSDLKPIKPRTGWDLMFRLLRTYYDNNGTTRVVCGQNGENSLLAQWVKQEKEDWELIMSGQKELSGADSDHLGQLDSIGFFSWSYHDDSGTEVPQHEREPTKEERSEDSGDQLVPDAAASAPNETDIDNQRGSQEQNPSLPSNQSPTRNHHTSPRRVSQLDVETTSELRGQQLNYHAENDQRDQTLDPAPPTEQQRKEAQTFEEEYAQHAPPTHRPSVSEETIELSFIDPPNEAACDNLHTEEGSVMNASNVDSYQQSDGSIATPLANRQTQLERGERGVLEEEPEVEKLPPSIFVSEETLPDDGPACALPESLDNSFKRVSPGNDPKAASSPLDHEETRVEPDSPRRISLESKETLLSDQNEPDDSDNSFYEGLGLDDDEEEDDDILTKTPAWKKRVQESKAAGVSEHFVDKGRLAEADTEEDSLADTVADDASLANTAADREMEEDFDNDGAIKTKEKDAANAVTREEVNSESEDSLRVRRKPRTVPPMYCGLVSPNAWIGLNANANTACRPPEIPHDWLLRRKGKPPRVCIAQHHPDGCRFGSRCHFAHVFHSSKDVVPGSMQDMPFDRDRIQYESGIDSSGGAWFTAGYILDQKWFLHAFGGNGVEEKGVWWYRSEKDAADAIGTVMIQNGAYAVSLGPAKQRSVHDSLPRLSVDWLTDGSHQHWTICKDFDKNGGTCRHGKWCKYAHVQKRGTGICHELHGPFCDRLIVVKAGWDMHQQQWFTSGYRNGNEYWYAAGGGNGVKCPYSGIWWYKSQEQAKEAIRMLYS